MMAGLDSSSNPKFSKRALRFHLPLSDERSEHGEPEHQGQGNEGALQGFAAHLRTDQVAASALENQGCSTSAVDQATGLGEQPPVLERFGQVQHGLALEHAAGVYLVVAQGQTPRLDLHAGRVLENLDHSAVDLAIISD